MNVKKWYTETYPSDELGYDMSVSINFYDVADRILNGHDIYNLLGVNDSLVRERVFLELSNVLSIEYETIYKTWINNIERNDFK